MNYLNFKNEDLFFKEKNKSFLEIYYLDYSKKSNLFLNQTINKIIK